MLLHMTLQGEHASLCSTDQFTVVALQVSRAAPPCPRRSSLEGPSLVAVTFTKCHPLDSSLPLIDFQLALVLTPVLLFGTSIGGRS